MVLLPQRPANFVNIVLYRNFIPSPNFFGNQGWVVFISHNQSIAPLAAGINGVVRNILSEPCEPKDFHKKALYRLRHDYSYCGYARQYICKKEKKWYNKNMPPLPSGPDSFSDFVNLICKAGDWFFTGLMAVAILMILFAAFQFLTASGNAQHVESAKKTLVYAIGGIIIAIIPKAIIAIISSMLTGSAIDAC